MDQSMRLLNEVKGRTWKNVRPSYFGHPTGARVAPQRCPILRKDKCKINEKTAFTSVI